MYTLKKVVPLNRWGKISALLNLNISGLINDINLN